MRKDVLSLSTPIRDLARELWRKPVLGTDRTGDRRILEIIERIRQAREPGAIADLMSLGLADETNIRSSARAAIAELVNLLSPESLAPLDEALRRAWGYLDYWHGLRPDVVSSLRPLTRDDVVFSRLIASHRNGYVRDEALKLPGHGCVCGGSSIHFVASRRLVDPIRKTAEGHVRQRLRSENAGTFVAYLPLLGRFAGSTRLNRDLQDEIMALLRDPKSV